MYDYGYASQYARSADIASVGAVAAFGTITMIVGLIGLVIAVLQIVAMWKIFVKAGEEGWKAIIPIYNSVVLFKIAGLSPWLLLIYIGMCIPFINFLASIAVIVISAILCGRLAKAFGKGTGFAVGLFFLSSIFYMILGFGSSTYQGAPEKAV